MKFITLSGVQCCIRENGSGGLVIFWGTGHFCENEMEQIWDALMKLVPQENFILAAFESNDWNRDFSPWPAPAVFKNEDFGGEGRKTLDWLTLHYIPYMEELYGKGRAYNLAGYSLSGLFALWAAYESDLFSGIVCCSGSLWYENWDRYVNCHQIRRACHIYLSLGQKEEKTRNPIMALVGERTRNQEKRLKSDLSVQSVILEWNPGGHFAEVQMRLAKGIRWLIQNQ